jgi:hypothetical protein
MKAVLENGIETLKKELVADAVEDYTDLSFFTADVEEAFGVSAEPELMLYTTAVVHSLLEDGLVRAGVPTSGGGFEPWGEEPDAAVERILSEWRALGRRPHLWEIVWFDSTDKGEAYAKEALSASE